MAKKTAVSKYLAAIGRKGGKKSGESRMEKMTPEQRQKVAKKAAEARWGKAQKQDSPAKSQGDPLVPTTKAKPAKKATPSEPLKIHGDKLDAKPKKKK